MSRKNYKILISVLIVIALGLGFMIQQRFTPQEPENGGDQTSPLIPSQPQPLAGDERAVLKAPAPDAPPEEKQRYFALVNEMAKEAEFLDITDCMGSPVVFQIKEKAKFTVKNNDDVPRTVYVDKEHAYTVPAHGTKVIQADFGDGPQAYGYGCGTVKGLAGLFLVTPE